MKAQENFQTPEGLGRIVLTMTPSRVVSTPFGQAYLCEQLHTQKQFSLYFLTSPKPITQCRARNLPRNILFGTFPSLWNPKCPCLSWLSVVSFLTSPLLSPVWVRAMTRRPEIPRRRHFILKEEGRAIKIRLEHCRADTWKA